MTSDHSDEQKYKTKIKIIEKILVGFVELDLNLALLRLNGGVTPPTPPPFSG